MSEQENLNEQEIGNVEDTPQGAGGIPIVGYTPINTKEKVAVIDSVTPVIDGSTVSPKSESIASPNKEKVKSGLGGYGGLGGSSKGYGGLGGRSSLLQKRLNGGSIHHFDSGEHFRQQAEKARDEQEERKQHYQHHPLTGEQSGSSHLRSARSDSVDVANEGGHNSQLQSGQIGRLRPRAEMNSRFGMKAADSMPRRFKENKAASESDSESDSD